MHRPIKYTATAESNIVAEITDRLIDWLMSSFASAVAFNTLEV